MQGTISCTRHNIMVPSAESLRPLPLKTQETGESSARTLVEENALIVIGRRGCCMCHVVKRLLLGLGVNPAVLEIDEEKEEEVMRELERIGVEGGRETVKFPAVYIGGRLFGGLDRVMATHISGELVPILKDVGALWL
ncbi:Glutaredoxin-C9 [Hirschfeldia incana]|nr:Glutaredoxin-C9 [Hirschfeldia incana]